MLDRTAARRPKRGQTALRSPPSAPISRRPALPPRSATGLGAYRCWPARCRPVHRDGGLKSRLSSGWGPMALRKTGPKVAGTRSSFFEIAPLKNTRGREEASLSRPRRARQPGWITGAEIDEALREFAKSLTERPILDQICENGRAARSAREEWFKAFAENLERATAGSTWRPSSRVTGPPSVASAAIGGTAVTRLTAKMLPTGPERPKYPEKSLPDNNS